MRGKGVIEPDAQERWAVDYRSQSVLNLDEFTQIVIHCVLYLNAGRTLNDAATPAQKWLDSGVSLLDVPPEELFLMSLPRETAKLTRKGLRLNGLLYVPADMEGLTLGEVYSVAHDPSDLSNVHILMDGGDFKPCRLSPHQLQYEGLSQQEADIVKQEERKLRGAAGKREVAASVTSIQGIQQIVKNASDASPGKVKQNGPEIQQNRTDERRLLS